MKRKSERAGREREDGTRDCEMGRRDGSREGEMARGRELWNEANRDGASEGYMERRTDGTREG